MNYTKNILLLIALIAFAINVVTVLGVAIKTGKEGADLVRVLKKDYPWTDPVAWIMLICIAVYVVVF